LRETVARAKLADLADVSDVALLKRLQHSEEWLRMLCLDMLRDSGVNMPEDLSGGAFRVVDSTIVKEPGKTGSQWRILYSVQLPTLVCDFFEVGAIHGKGAGESFRRLPVQPQDMILGDAGFWSAAGIESIVQQGADVLVRVNPRSFLAYGPKGHRFALLTKLQELIRPGQVGEWPIALQGQASRFAGRICAIRKTEEAYQRAKRRLERKASKRQLQITPDAFEYAKYVILFTTRSGAPAEQVLDWYRLRWQIELVFKRLKTLARLGHLPKHDERSSRAWLYGKLLVALLSQKLIRIGRDVSPWGYVQSS